MTDTLTAVEKRTIRDLRLEKDMSGFDVAVALGSHPASVHSWETRKSRPRPDMIRKLCEFFDVSEEQLDLAPYRKPGTPIGSRFVRAESHTA